MPTEKGLYVLDTDASVVAILGILHQEHERNGRTVLSPIAYGSKLFSDTELKYGAQKAEKFGVVTFVEKYRAYLRSAPFKLRVDNRVLSWLKTYSMDQSYFSHWIVRLDGTGCVKSTRMLTDSVRRLSFMRDWSRSRPIRRKSRKDSRFLIKRLMKHFP